MDIVVGQADYARGCSRAGGGAPTRRSSPTSGCSRRCAKLPRTSGASPRSRAGGSASADSGRSAAARRTAQRWRIGRSSRSLADTGRARRRCWRTLQALSLAARGVAARRLIADFTRQPPTAAALPPLGALTSRETDVLTLIAQGKPNIRDQRRPVHRTRDHQDPRQAHPGQTRPPRPRPGCHGRLRNRPGHPGRITVPSAPRPHRRLRGKPAGRQYHADGEATSKMHGTLTDSRRRQRTHHPTSGLSGGRGALSLALRTSPDRPRQR